MGKEKVFLNFPGAGKEICANFNFPLAFSAMICIIEEERKKPKLFQEDIYL